MPPIKKPSRRIVPQSRRINGKLTRFAPDRAAELYTLNSLDHVADSIEFWMKQMRQQACPDCGVVGTMRVCILQSGIEIHCSRIELDKCDWARESQFFGQT